MAWMKFIWFYLDNPPAEHLSRSLDITIINKKKKLFRLASNLKLAKRSGVPTPFVGKT